MPDLVPLNADSADDLRTIVTSFDKSILRAAAASVDISPPRPGRLFCSGDTSEDFKRVESALEATAVVVADAGQRFVLLSFDLLYVGPVIAERLKRFLVESHGIAANHVLLAASHTHFAMGTDPTKPRFGAIAEAYIDLVCRRTEKLLDGLLTIDLPPVALRSGTAVANHSINRRRFWPIPRISKRGLHLPGIVIAPNARGPRDETVRCIELRQCDDDRLVTVIWQYTCHPTGYPDSLTLCAEYPGVVRSALRTAHRKDLPVLFFQGFSGDIRPAVYPPQSLLEAASACIRGPRFGRFDTVGWLRWAQGIADSVHTAMANATPVRLQPESTRGLREILPLAEIIDGAVADRAVEFQRLSIGGVVEFFGISAEPTHSWAGRLSGIGATHALRIPVGCCGDTYGYLPTCAEVRAGGYEANDHLHTFGLSGHFSDAIDARVAEVLGRLAAC